MIVRKWIPLSINKNQERAFVTIMAYRMSIMNICSIWVIPGSNSYSLSCRESTSLKSGNRMIFKFSIVWLLVSYAPDSNSDTPIFSGLSGKKMALLVDIIIAGGFFGIQAMFGFPIKDLIRKDVRTRLKSLPRQKERVL
jgi:hypothetical protein